MEINQVINSYISISEDLDAGLNDTIREVEDFNLILSDLDHFIELEDLSNIDVAKVTCYRIQVLRDRRKAKDRIRVIEQILPKQIKDRTTRDRFEYAVGKLGTRVYTPRKVTLDQVLQRAA